MDKFIENVASGLNNLVDKMGAGLLVVIGICIIGAVYLAGLIIMLNGAMFKFAKKLKICNIGLDAIRIVDKSNKRHFYGILNGAPVGIKKCWQDYEYFRSGRVIDYFKRDEIIENVKRHSCGKSLLMLGSIVFPLIIFAILLVTDVISAFVGLFFFTLTVGILQLTAILLSRTIRKKAYKELDYFLEQLNAKANWYAEIERPKTMSLLEDYATMETTVENDIRVGEANDILNADLISKAISHKSLKKSERDKIANSIMQQAEANQILADEINDKKNKKKIKPESIWKEEEENNTIANKPKVHQVTYANVPTPNTASALKTVSVPVNKTNTPTDYPGTTRLIEEEIKGATFDDIKPTSFEDIIAQIREVKIHGADKPTIQRLLFTLQKERKNQNLTAEQMKRLNSEINEMLTLVKNNKTIS